MKSAAFLYAGSAASIRTCRLGSIVLGLLTACLCGRAHGEDFGLCFGGGGAVEAPAPKLPAEGKQLCVEFRFKAMAPAAATVRLVSQWSDDIKSPDAGAFHLDLLQGNRAAFTLRVGKGRTDTVTGKDTWTPNAWHHLLATWNGSEAALYLDGKLVGTRKIDGAAVPVSTLPLTIGQAPPVGKTATVPPAFKGFISDVAVWSAVPAAEAIAQRVAKPIDDQQQGLAAHVPLRDTGPAEMVKEKVSGQEAKIAPALARTGWCATSMWDQPAPEQPSLPLFSYDLSAPARNASSGGSDATPALVKPSRMTLLQNPKTQQFGVLWQDKSSNGIFITWLDADLKGHETMRLKSMDDGILAAGCTDPNGNLCYLEVQKVPTKRDASTPLKAFLHGAATNGKPLGEVPVSTADAKDGLNLWSYGGRWVGSMTYSNGAFGLIIPRTMYQSPDGLNHQGAIAVVFPANDPSKYRNLGQVTGHSFGNVISVNSSGDFITLDLGDCYPRGVNLTKFTATSKSSRVVYTYKTEHSTSAKAGTPKYDEISKDGKTYYKWSNDNNTYTELGGVVEGRVSYSAIFASDRSTEGKVLDNSRAFRNCDDPRDLVMVRVVKNFDQIQSGHEISESLLAGGVPAGSTSETGGFFNFVGHWTKQRQVGAIYLTKHKTGEAAHAPHPVRLPDGNILILWEKTGSGGAELRATKVSEEGKVLGEWVRPGSDLHLSREDKFISMGGRSFVLATEKSGAVRLCFVYEDLALPTVAKATTPAGKPAK